MDQRKEFEKWWGKGKAIASLGIFEQRLAEEIAWKAWQAKPAEDAAPRLHQAVEDRLRSEDWFRTVCAEELGIDTPGGDGCHPLRDLLRELVKLRTMHNGGVLTPLQLLEALSKTGGAAGALGEAGLIFEKKGKDYNTGFTRDDYFPLGLASYAQMLWVKSLRLLSFAKQPRLANFEGPRDTALDLINYAAFLADWLERRKGE